MDAPDLDPQACTKDSMRCTTDPTHTACARAKAMLVAEGVHTPRTAPPPRQPHRPSEDGTQHHQRRRNDSWVTVPVDTAVLDRQVSCSESRSTSVACAIGLSTVESLTPPPREIKSHLLPPHWITSPRARDCQAIPRQCSAHNHPASARSAVMKGHGCCTNRPRANSVTAVLHSAAVLASAAQAPARDGSPHLTRRYSTGNVPCVPVRVGSSVRSGLLRLIF